MKEIEKQLGRPLKANEIQAMDLFEHDDNYERYIDADNNLAYRRIN